MTSCVATPLAIFSWTEEEEESNTGEIIDGLVRLGSGLVGLIKGLEGRDLNGADLGRRRVLICVGRELVSQDKVELAIFFRG